MGARVTLKGTDKLKVVLEGKTNLSAVKTVVKANGAGLQTKAQRNAPVDTGFLKRSIGLAISDGGLTATVEPTAEYAPYVEWGTRYMEAQPFVRPAFYTQKEQFKRDLNKIVK